MTESTELRTERLLLRPFRLSDIDDVLEYASDPEWARYLPREPQPYTREAAEKSVARRVLESWKTHPNWAIVFDEKVVGGIILMIDVKHEIGELGYELSRGHWGKGLMDEAAGAVMDWGFRERGLAKVYAIADGRNARSIRVMEKAGMTREGVLRSHIKARDGRADDVYYGILREEWASPSGPLPPAPVPAEQKAADRTGPVELRTERLLLRPFGPGDVGDVFEYARDPEWAEYLLNSVPQPYTLRNAEEFIARQMRASAEKEPTWAIVLDSTVIGGIGLDIDSRRDTGELHYGLGKASWGLGFMPEAAGAVVDWGFGERRLAKVSAHADLRNRRSWRVMEKLGMAREGMRRSQGKDVRPDGPRTDYVYYGLLREEWNGGGIPQPPPVAGSERVVGAGDHQ